MKWLHVKTVWRKEILDTIRDRRTLIAGIVAPLILMPLLTFGSMALVSSMQQKAVEEKTPIVVQGAAEAPKLLELIKATNQFQFMRPASPAKALKDGQIMLLVKIPRGFEEQAVKGTTPAKLTIEYQAKKMTASVALDKLRACVENYKVMSQVARLGLKDPGILQTVAVEEKNVSTDREMSGMLFGTFLPFILAMVGIMGGMYTAIDAVAGEKERRTLETLVITPPTRASLATGKCLAVFTTSAVAVILSAVSSFVCFHYGLPLIVSSGEARLTLDPGSLGILIVAALPYLAMLSGLQIAISALGKSFKETQNYFSILMIGVMIPGMAMMFMDKQLSALVYAVPFVNVTAVFKDAFAGSWSWLNVVICSLTNAVFCGFTLSLAQRVLAKEKLMFKS